MANSRGPSAQVTAAAILAILGSLLTLLGCSLAFFAFLSGKMPASPPEMPPFVRTMMLGTQGFMICLSIFGVATGIGLIYLRNWARISILIWGSVSVIFGLLGMLVIFFMPFLPSSSAPSRAAVNMSAVRMVLLLVYGAPLMIGVWWLVLFNRKSVKAQFAASAPPPVPGQVPKPACPAPIAVLAWFYITSILNLLFFPLMPAHVPVFLFGWILPSTLGRIFLLLSFLAFFVLGIGLLKLKPWSYSLTMGFQIFWLVSSAVSLFSPNYKTAMNSYMRGFRTSMHLPESPFAPLTLSQFSLIIGLGILAGAALIAMMVYYRQRFLENAARAASLS